MKKFPMVSLLKSLLIPAFVATAHADSHTWSGAGLTPSWSIPANWAGNNPPAANETPPVTLTFPAGAARLTNTNNISGLVVDSILFTGSGYAIGGSGGGTNLTVRGTSGATVLGFANTTNAFSSSMDLVLSNNVQFTVNSPGQLQLNGLVRGTGNMIKQGGGVLTYFGDAANPCTGSNSIVAGTLRVFCGNLFSPQRALAGPVKIGGGAATATLEVLAGNQLSSTAPLLIDDHGVLDLGANSATCGPLTLNGGSVTSTSGTLTLNGNVTVMTNSGGLSGRLSLGGVTRQFSVVSNAFLSVDSIVTGNAGVGLTKTGAGYLSLGNSNQFSGPVTVAAGSLVTWHPLCFGNASSITVSNGGNVIVPGYTITNHLITLNGSGPDGAGALVTGGGSVWQGGIYLASDSVIGNNISNQSLTLSGAITGPGALIIGGAGEQYGRFTLSGTDDNTFTGGLVVQGTNTLYLNKSAGAAAVPGALEIGANFSPLVTQTKVVLNAAHQIANSSIVTIHQSGSMDLNGFGETVGGLVLDGGNVGGQSWLGTLTLGGDVVTTAKGGDVYCPLSLGGQTRAFTLGGNLSLNATVVDGGASAGMNLSSSQAFGRLSLYASNSFSGAIAVSGACELYVEHNYALGTTGQGVWLTNQACLNLVDVQIAGEPLMLAGDFGYVAVRYYNTNSWSGPVTLNSTPRLVNGLDSADKLTLSGPIGGASGLDLNGAGTVTVSGAQNNTYAGTTRLLSGNLRLQKGSGVVAIPNSLEVGTDLDPTNSARVLFLADNQILPGPVGYLELHNSGWLDLNNHVETVPQIYFYENGHIDTGSSGLLTLDGNVTVSADTLAESTINGQLSLGNLDRHFYFMLNTALATDTLLTINASIRDTGSPAGIIAHGGWLTLTASNSFRGEFIGDNNVLFLKNTWALGKTNAGITLTNGGVLSLASSVTNETLQTSGLNPPWIFSVGSNIWSGPMQLLANTALTANSTNDALTINGPVTGSANIFASGAGTLRLSGAAPNTLSGAFVSTISQLDLAKTNSTAISGPLQIDGGTVRLLTGNQLLDTSAVTVNSNGVFNLNHFSETIGDLNGAGGVRLGAGILTVSGGSPTNFFNGNISGLGGELDKIGGNTLILTGTNTYTSATQVKGGTLIVHGYQPASDVYVLAGATLGGSGTVGNLYASGQVSPGDNGPGRLTTSNATFNAGSKLSLELNGTVAGISYDQLNVNGTVSLNALAGLQVTQNFTGAVSNQFTLIANDGADGITGNFAGLFDGSTFNVGANQFLLRYYANSPANDLAITQLSVGATSSVLSVVRSGNGSVQLTGQGVANLTYTVQANTNLMTTNWVPIGSTTANSGGNWNYTDAAAANFAARFYRLVWP